MSQPVFFREKGATIRFEPRQKKGGIRHQLIARHGSHGACTFPMQVSHGIKRLQFLQVYKEAFQEAIDWLEDVSKEAGPTKMD